MVKLPATMLLQPLRHTSTRVPVCGVSRLAQFTHQLMAPSLFKQAR